MTTVYKPFTLKIKPEAHFWAIVFRIMESLDIRAQDAEVSETARIIHVKKVGVDELTFGLLPWASFLEDTEPNMGAQGINIFFWRVREKKVEVTTGFATPNNQDWEEAD